ncbi:hypothetical protein EC973_002107 [Apophysomyces ossiformis]|uniref:Uncharacterized protein n=1 Tax=Apophysomyces ossiformis TaxID=679940 RepID=A0A8H7BNB7_9FUNG|nr:hypothetical protein EC973_002107 [Apophysomyces ossiformis]
MATDLLLYKLAPSRKSSCLRLSRRQLFCAIVAIALILLYMNIPSKQEPTIPLPGNTLSHTASASIPSFEPSSNLPTSSQPDIFEKHPTYSVPELSGHMNANHTFATPRPLDEDIIVIDYSNHYTYLIIIASEAGYLSRRRLIRQHYFGLHDNTLPCMQYNTDVYYKFWIHGGSPEAGTIMKRRYEAEKMEWDDLVEMPPNVTFEQANVLEWVHTELSHQDITYDYLIIQDIHTFAHLSTIKRELDSGVISDNTDSPVSLSVDAPFNMIWGTFRGHDSDKQFAIIGRTAVQLALQQRNNVSPQLKATNSGISMTGKHLLTELYNYYTAHASSLEAALNQAIEEPELAEAERERTIPEFIREDGPEGTHRFIRWENNIESVHAEDIVVTHVYQDAEMTDLAIWTNLRPISVCYSTASTFQPTYTATSLEPLDDDEEPVKKEDVETTYFSNAPTEGPSIAVVTSSYLHDACMELSASASAANKRDYAKQHGYAFVARSSEFAQQVLRDNRNVVWGKIDVLQKLLPKYEWLLWLDMDAVIMNMDKSLENLIDTFRSQYPGGKADFDDTVDIIIARRSSDEAINAGVFLIRNSIWSNNFLRDLQNIEEWYKKGPYYEEGALKQLISQPSNRQHVLLLDHDDQTFNTLPKSYQSDSFILHFAEDKCSNNAVLKALAMKHKP